tara:strand:- start:7505 stop:7873 length:369 start_codon:yes stop_codon:yes gene_type:complete
MLDIDLQKRLDSATLVGRTKKTTLSKPQLWGMAIAIALSSATIGAVTHAYVTNPPALHADDLGRLTVLVSEKNSTVPADIWSAMEQHIGKSADEFTSKDQMKAIAFLLYLVDKEPQETINIW